MFNRKEYQKEYDRKRYEANKETTLLRNAKWMKENRESNNKSVSKYFKTAKGKEMKARNDNLPGLHSFSGAKSRCNNMNDKDYVRYGAKGIKCTWATYEDFANDMIDKNFVKGSHLHRIDNSGDYSKANCEWLSPKEHTRLHQVDKKVVI